MPAAKFKAAISVIDWQKNVDALLADKASAETLEAANLKLAIWSRQLEGADANNPALCFVREMQIAGQHVAVLIALALYKPAAGSIRSVLETALYYSYFRTHFSELETLARGTGYYLEKRQVIDFHKEHSLLFVERQQKLGLLSRLEGWYGRVSSLVHGHIPGVWIEHKSVSEIAPIKITQDLAIKLFAEGVDIVHRLFLCTVAQTLWDSFSSESKKQLLSGLQGDEKKILKLDIA
ncbi:hypothetical protein JQ612_34275 [Bradyrhizobium manausense]|uniref:hypothetical protein n=1 Tax=Bradyrhizobium manausense TaxID=989370 RepID=UPI001BAD8EDB|nr:hypothetical protein [Bradyrhizobium manausense]MBR0838293.1 hypothetical protein [Bradyrhizobium manausense]